MKHSLQKIIAVMMAVVLFGCFPLQAGAAESPISYTSAEKEMLGYIVQQEAGGLSLSHKQIIAQIVVNRVESDAFPNTIYDVLTQKNQFSSLANWYSKHRAPDSDTLQAVSDVLNGEYDDQTMGATFFYAPRWAGKSAASWFENSLCFLFTMDGHRFFKAQ